VILKSILLALAIPPLCLVVLAMAGLVLTRRRPALGQGIVACSLLGLLLLAMPAVSSTLLGGLERNLPTTAQAATSSAATRPAAIIVLGAEISRSVEEPDGALVGRLTLERLRAAAALQRRTKLPVLVSGGTAQTDAPAVGKLMARSLVQDFQVPVQWVETESRDTWENAQRSADILRGQGIRSVYVVTHPWHMRRALIAFAHTDLIVTAAPTPLSRPIGPIAIDFLPRVGAWETSYFALHEWIGCAWYALR
jgi:uncharacterized SAM-binding protein YcdF (DUF218 family)